MPDRVCMRREGRLDAYKRVRAEGEEGEFYSELVVSKAARPMERGPVSNKQDQKTPLGCSLERCGKGSEAT